MVNSSFKSMLSLLRSNISEKMLEKLFIKEKDYHEYTKKIFNLIAPRYWFIELFMDGLKQKMVKMSGAAFNDKVIDFCCGVGTLAMKLAKVTQDVTGIDLTPGMLETAKKNNKNKTVKFLEMDAAKTSFSDKSFDISFISSSLHDMPHEIRIKILEEMRRITKKKIVIADYNIPENWLRGFYNFFVSFYESKYYKDFARRDFKDFLKQQRLKIIKESCSCWFLFKIYVCEIE